MPVSRFVGASFPLCSGGFVRACVAVVSVLYGGLMYRVGGLVAHLLLSVS